MRKLEVFSFNKQIFHAVSLSGGKDSTAMLLLMIERSLPINTVLWADTGMEFPEMYDHIRKVDDYLYRERGIHITMLRHPKGFEYLMFEEEKQKPSSIENRQRLGVSLYGNGWPGAIRSTPMHSRRCSPPTSPPARSPSGWALHGWTLNMCADLFLKRWGHPAARNGV